MTSFIKKLREQLIVTSDDGESVWSGIDRSTSDIKVFEQTKFQPARLSTEWDDEIPHVTLVVDVGTKTATLMAHEEVPEDMMFFLLDCFQQEGLGGVKATRAEVRKINVWVKRRLMKMESDGMIWREEGKWIFEG